MGVNRVFPPVEGRDAEPLERDELLPELDLVEDDDLGALALFGVDVDLGAGVVFGALVVVGAL